MTDGVIQATGDLFPKLPDIHSEGGVAMNPPPDHLLGEVSSLVTAAMSGMPEDGKVRLVGIATKTGTHPSVNLAAAVKLGDGVKIVGWIGKTWGQPVGASVLGVWDF